VPSAVPELFACSLTWPSSGEHSSANAAATLKELESHASSCACAASSGYRAGIRVRRGLDIGSAAQIQGFKPTKKCDVCGHKHTLAVGAQTAQATSSAHWSAPDAMASSLSPGPSAVKSCSAPSCTTKRHKAFVLQYNRNVFIVRSAHHEEQPADELIPSRQAPRDSGPQPQASHRSSASRAAPGALSLSHAAVPARPHLHSASS